MKFFSVSLLATLLTASAVIAAPVPDAQTLEESNPFASLAEGGGDSFNWAESTSTHCVGGSDFGCL